MARDVISLGGITAEEKAEDPFRALENPVMHFVCTMSEKFSYPFPLLFVIGQPFSIRRLTEDKNRGADLLTRFLIG